VFAGLELLGGVWGLVAAIPGEDPRARRSSGRSGPAPNPGQVCHRMCGSLEQKGDPAYLVIHLHATRSVVPED